MFETLDTLLLVHYSGFPSATCLLSRGRENVGTACGVSAQAHAQSRRSCSADQDRYRGARKEDKLEPKRKTQHFINWRKEK